MITITFPDRDTQKRALGFLLGRFSGRVLRSGEHLVPEAALEALADQNIPFTVKGKATCEQQVGGRFEVLLPLQFNDGVTFLRIGWLMRSSKSCVCNRRSPASQPTCWSVKVRA